MKTNGTPILIIRIILFILISLYSIVVFGQPDYDFRGATLISGVDRQVNAVYRFNNVKTGVHANVTITAMTNGLTITTIDGAGGFVEALQPTIDVPAGRNGYLEMRIDFLNSLTLLPAVQLEVPVTPIDVDGQVYGGRPVNEYDMIQLISGYANYDMLGGELVMGFPRGWVTGNNVASIDYAGIDTVAKQVMFTVVNAGISSIIVRVGANNQTNASRQRLRSIYFMKFNYQNAYLASSGLVSFSGNKTGSAVKLNWSLDNSSEINTVILERKSGSQDFKTLTEYTVNQSRDFSFTDNQLTSGKHLYRLKLVWPDGKTEYSNVLSFHAGEETAQFIKVYPTVINNQATADIYADKAQRATIQWTDMTGKVLQRQNTNLQKGSNSLSVTTNGGLPKGNYIISVALSDKIYSDRVMIQ